MIRLSDERRDTDPGDEVPPDAYNMIEDRQGVEGTTALLEALAYGKED